MKKLSIGAIAVLAMVSISLVGCTSVQSGVGLRRQVTRAVAVIRPVQGGGSLGTVTFIQEGRHVRIIADMQGLTPGKHGIHVHEFGDTSAFDGTSAGGHFNPRNTPHGAPTAEVRHVGDLGNLEVDRNGVATYNRLDEVITLNGPNSVVGRAVVVKAGPDDFKTQPGGAAGARIAWGVIGIGALSSE